MPFCVTEADVEGLHFQGGLGPKTTDRLKSVVTL